MKQGQMESSYALLKESEAMLSKMKTHWAENEEHLGKIIDDKSALRCLTSTSYNIGMYHKLQGNYK